MHLTAERSMQTSVRAVDGLAIRYAESGNPEADPVLMLSPWPESLYAWETIWPRVKPVARLVAIDLPGFGASEYRSDLIGLLIALAVLSVALGTVATAALPPATALVGVACGLLGVSAVSGLTTLHSTAPTLATMLGLAVGIDYAWFIVSRHRQNLQDGMDVRTDRWLVIATAGGAVCFAGTTVVIALYGVLVVGIPFFTVMGSPPPARS